MLVGGRLVQPEQLPGSVAVQLQVLIQTLAGLLEVGGRLLQRQRQISQKLRQPAQRPLITGPGAPA